MDRESIQTSISSSTLEQNQQAIQTDPRLEEIEEKDNEKYLVEWQLNDIENPFNWKKSRKWIVTIICCFYTAQCAMASSAYVIGLPTMDKDLGISSIVGLSGITAYTFGFAVGPMALAPLSEVFGRSPVYLITYFVFFMFMLPIALAQNLATIISCRFIAGVASSTGSTMVGGTISDIWLTHERGNPMGFFAFFTTVGIGLGPAFAGFIYENLGWRWIHWIQFIFYGVFFLVLVFVLQWETRGSVLLSRRAKKLKKSTGKPYYAKADIEKASFKVLVKVSLTRPFHLLFFEPTVFFATLWISFAWGVMYLFLESLVLVLENLHGFSPGWTGIAFLSTTIAAIIASGLNIIQERLYRIKTKKGKIVPEARLYAACVGGIFFPAGLFMYGWTSGLNWFTPLIAVVIIFTGLSMIYLAIFNYLSDTYTIYASSALAAQGLGRNICGAVFPLFTLQMYERLGYEWSGSLLGFIASALAIIPFVFYFYGHKIRARSAFAIALEGEEESRR